MSYNMVINGDDNVKLLDLLSSYSINKIEERDEDDVICTTNVKEIKSDNNIIEVIPTDIINQKPTLEKAFQYIIPNRKYE